MEYRGIDSKINNLGFRMQYNRLFKPEYLPARVKYNQFFVLAITGVWFGLYKSKVRMRYPVFFHSYTRLHILSSLVAYTKLSF